MERKVLELIATDRMEIPTSSMYQKLKRAKSKEAKEIAAGISNEDFKGKYDGERVFAYVQENDREKARGMKEAVEQLIMA